MMNNYFTYSVLKYKYSIVLGEILNVGILFYFPEENIFEFVSGDGARVKSIYPDFDTSLFNAYIKVILAKVKKHVDLFTEKYRDFDLGKYIQKYILAEDAAGLIFHEPVYVKDIYNDRKKTIDEYSKLLLPRINIVKPNIIK